jgi:hypothetical protein
MTKRQNNLSAIIKYISENASWIFSGIGITAITGISLAIKAAYSKPNDSKNQNNQTQTVSGNGEGYQAGGDIKIGSKPTND